MAEYALNSAALDARRTAPSRIVGGRTVMSRIAIKLSQRQFVTIIGPGGMGKSTIARAAAVDLRAAYPDGVFVVDVATLATPDMLHAAIAAAMGLAREPGDSLAVACRHVARRQSLIVLDGCERLLLAAAAAAEKLLAASPGVSILATSREALLADGEWLHRMPPLTLPEPNAVVNWDDAQTFTAIQLFVDRALHANPDAVFSDDQARTVCNLCRCLDGIPLAIELAAARLSTLSLDGLAAQIDDRLAWRDDQAHSPEPRHRTLAETLDWSYDLLSATEQVVLRRISLFCGTFGMPAAIVVASDPVISELDVADAMTGLVAKSLVVATDHPADARYRLLDTTRDYASSKLKGEADFDAAARRHARFLKELIAEADARWDAAFVDSCLPWFDDVRHALDWSLAASEEASTIVGLALGGFAMTRHMGGEIEFKPRIEAALRFVRKLSPGQPLLEMRLNKCINSISHVPRAHEIAMVDALKRQLSDDQRNNRVPASSTVASGIAMMTGFFGSAAFCADYPRMNEWSQRIDELARRSGDAMALLTADRVRAQTLHWGGAHAMAGRVARKILDGNCFRIPFAYNPSPIDLGVSMRIVLARTLWLQGSATRASQVIAEGMRCAIDDSPLSQCMVIAMGALPIALWSGFDAQVADLLSLLKERATRCSIGDWSLWADELAQVVALRRASHGDRLPVEPGVEIQDVQLMDHICTLRRDRVTPRQVDRVLSGEAAPWIAAEILRAHAVNQLAGDPDEGTRTSAEALLRQSLGLANIQGALAWELRTAVSLGRLLQSTGRASDARVLLVGILRRVKESGDTRDFVEATALVSQLS